MKDEYYDDPYLMDKVWYSPDNLMSNMTPDKMQWALCWGFMMHEGKYPPSHKGNADAGYSKAGYYKAAWENAVTCIAWIRRLLDREGVGGEMWIAHLDCPGYRIGMSIEQLSKYYQMDIEVVKHLMNRAIHHACKKHMENRHLWERQ